MHKFYSSYYYKSFLTTDFEYTLRRLFGNIKKENHVVFDKETKKKEYEYLLILVFKCF